MPVTEQFLKITNFIANTYVYDGRRNEKMRVLVRSVVLHSFVRPFESYQTVLIESWTWQSNGAKNVFASSARLCLNVCKCHICCAFNRFERLNNHITLDLITLSPYIWKSETKCLANYSLNFSLNYLKMPLYRTQLYMHYCALISSNIYI